MPLSFRRLAAPLAAALLALAAGAAHAQAPQAPPTLGAPPKPAFEKPGWRHENGPSDIHFFLCDAPTCDRSTRASYQVLGVKDMSFDQFKADKRQVLEMLKKRLPAGAAIFSDDIRAQMIGGARVMVEKRHVLSAEGRTNWTMSAVIVGARQTVSLIVSSNDEKDLAASFAVFAEEVATLAGR